MLKKKNIYNILIIIVYIISCSLIYQETKTTKKTNTKSNTIVNKNELVAQKDKQDDYILELIIKKIGINKRINKISSSQIDVDENIIILEGSTFPDKKESTLFIAAHSGEGENAYFNNLDKLSINDEITIVYNNKNYYYIVTNNWEEDKNGYIHVSKKYQHQLILTTCSKNKDKQLVVSARLLTV